MKRSKTEAVDKGGRNEDPPPNNPQACTFVTNPEEQEESAPCTEVNQSEVSEEEKVSVIEINENPALRILDNLSNSGRISSAKATYFKEKYLKMQQLLTQSSSKVSRLHEEYSEYLSSQQELMRKLEEANKYPKNIAVSTEITSLRESFLSASNKYAEVKERLLHYEFKIECLTEEKTVLLREVTKQPKPGEVQAKLKDLQKYIEDLKKDTQQTRVDSKQLLEEKSEKITLQEQEVEECNLLKEKLGNIQMELYQIASEPNQIAKEADKISRKIQDIEKKKMIIQLEFDECFEVLRNLESISMERDKEKQSLVESIHKTSLSKSDIEKNIYALKSSLEQVKDKLAQKCTEKDEVDISIQQMLNEKQRRLEYVTIMSRNIEKDQRELKKAELQVKIAKDNLNHLRNILNKISQQKESVPTDDENRSKKIQELKTENELKSQQLSAQNRVMATENMKFDKSVQCEQELLQEYFEGDLELQELSRLAIMKTVERDKKARDKNRADNRHRCIKEELKAKYGLIDDHKKKLREKKKRLKVFAQKYESMKTDRNKYVSLIQSSTQKTSELRQKIKIIQNEMEILRTAVVLKDKQLHKERLKHMQNVLLRDALREDIDKHHRKVIDLEEQCEQQKIEIRKFNYMINQTEEHMIKLRKRYENAIQERNKKGEWLIKINSEVCLFYEKFNVQNDMITKGNSELENFEQELKIMHLEKSSLLREINVLDRQLPERKPLLEKLRNAKFDHCEWEIKCKIMAKSVVERDNEKYLRFLHGNDPSPLELSQKIEKLEVRLSNMEKQLMEKDLLIKQVTHLLERTKHKADTGKDDTLKLAKSINDMQRKIKETTRKMMSMTAELSMNQANAMMLNHELKQQEDLVGQCYARMAQGEAPSEAMEQEWLRKKNDEQQQKNRLLEQQLLEEEDTNLRKAGSTFTTAEQRPNAYMPDIGCDLPVPRPYGKHAPFKPTEPGSNIRHIRKPNPVILDI
ncbi:Hypothetical predicted protein [Octopus vulgaris]|uniref:Uncharacterized protein n=2 Tax=Octopus TaxID=6643 RepID=A0AA36AHH6_OCTVU|nr:coiled-coil domain-containing protein 146-like [Octopus sinensis]XP_036362252.1 coiled-coil domain-containing protein 146-like [Octopus sinensis]XP_036362258.1 coiled-coil domain-containing protein 146-like [Octopus sinensis]XP_036362267.1 coiled-coil domain-containing protein 146-like [Octopus sinensis]XP_036362283.1 coiled-coil domain-containing protein 146-like [Octopus sinensis]CAI9716280.1 Hypothetical predicted protein [Octopus vulgaris]